MTEKRTCDMCHKPKKNVELQPSRRQLIYGGFPQRYEYRCPACESKVDRWIQRILNGMEKMDERI